MTTNLPEQRQPSSEVLSKAQKLEQLRRKIAAIPAGNNVDALPESIAEPVRKVETPASTDTTRSTLRVLPVPDPIAALLPHRGLARGAVAAVDGAASILVGLLAAATAAGHRAAVIGLPRLGLLAVTEHGGDLSRIALIPDPRDAAVEVAAIMLDGVDVVVLGLSGAAVTPSRARAVTARARSKGSVLLVTQGNWPGVDLRIEATVTGYRGVEGGRGRINAVQFDVAAAGKGFQRRTQRMEIRDGTGNLTWKALDGAPKNNASDTRLLEAL